MPGAESKKRIKMTILPDRTTFRRRLKGLFQDWRWDGTWSLRTIPTDGRAPLFGSDDTQCQRHRRIIVDMLAEGFPGSEVHFVNLDNSVTEWNASDDPAAPARLITLMCHDLANKDKRPLTHIFIYQRGAWQVKELLYQLRRGAQSCTCYREW